MRTLPARCPVCRASPAGLVYSGRDRVASSYHPGAPPCGLSLFQCRRCGMLFLKEVTYSPEMVHEAYWRMLTENKQSDFSVRGAIDLPGLGRYRKTNRLFEVGCGDGMFLRRAREVGWAAAGVDISATAVALARDNGGQEVIQGRFDERVVAQAGEGTCDVVVMLGVVEHVENPLEVLALAGALLRPGGALVVYTPNAESIYHRLARLSHRLSGGSLTFFMERVIIAMHTLYFSRGTLSRALESSGFRVEAISLVDIDLDFIFKVHGRFWWSATPFRWSARLLQAASGLCGMNSHMLALAEKTAGDR